MEDPVKIDLSLCNQCGICEVNCPGDLIYSDEKGNPYLKYPEECWFCGACRMDCPKDCIEIIFPMEVL